LSALTKVAVALLVVASLMLSAGVVVFVNKVDHFETALKTTNESYKKEQAAHNDTRSQLATANSELLSQAKDSNARLAALQTELTTAQATAQAARGELAAREQEKKGVEVAMQNMVKVQEGLQGQLGAATQQVTELRKIRDQLVEERHTLNVQLTDAVAKIDALDRQRKNAEERAASNQARVDDLATRMQKAGFSSPESLPNRGVAGGPALEGVVSGVFNAGGKPWASISLGSKANVEKGMRFNVVNNNEFLGYLTVQTTEPDEAAGVLEGPGVTKVKQGDQVKTQLQ
jgi:regulator of replication initiation timing